MKLKPATKKSVLLTLPLLLPAFLSNELLAQQAIQLDTGPKSVRVVRTTTPPNIDGRLDDAVWQQAEVITDFHQIRPGNGTPPSERTEVYLLYDDDFLYIGARMYDSNPELIAAPTIRHGQGLGADDRLVVILDPFNTGRTGYRFETNLNAVRHDALYQSVTSFQMDWSTIWDVATSVEDDAWIAEIAIPFKSLPMDTSIDTWGFNFGRGIRRRGEEMAWVSYNRTYNPSIVGYATGLTGMDQGLGLDVVPSLSVNRRRTFNPGASDSNIEPSLDVFYRLTPSLNAALTINTDFSATEVDDRQVNLTRFNLFFPEKRDFFLNDADLFQFGGIGGGGSNQATSRGARENARPYFSRRIGLGQDGSPVDINYGGRISGRLGRWNIGALAIRQDDAPDQLNPLDASNLFVARISANVLNESELGFIITDGDPGSNLSNSVYGVDFRYQNTRLPGGRVLEGDAWIQQSDTPGLNGDDRAWGLALRSPNNSGLRGGAGVKEVEANFNPAMGYVNRAGIRDITADTGYTHYFSNSYFQTAYAGIDAQRIERLNGGLQSQEIKLRVLELENSTRDGIDFSYMLLKESVLTPFTIYSDINRQVVIPPGEYSFNEWEIDISTGNQRMFSGSLSYLQGDFYDGDRDNISASVAWAQSRYFRMSVNYEWNNINLPQGDFITRLSSINTQVAFNSTMFWTTLVQYDNVSEVLGINTRFQWIPRAGQEALFVINHNLHDRDKDNSFVSDNSDISLKLKYTFRY